MSLFRTVVVLVGALLLMLTMIVLRTETARLHYRISQYDQKSDALQQELREAELELQRLRNPALIRMKAAELRESGEAISAPDPAERPLPPGPKSRKP